MAVSLSTAGILVGYAEETVADTKPTTFTHIPRAMSLPDFNPAPNNIDVTPLDAEAYKEYVAGLRDLGSSMAITFSLNDQFMTLWDGIVSKYDTLVASGKTLWMEFWIPKMSKAFFFQFQPTPLGFKGASPDSHLEIDAYVTPTGHVGWSEAVKPTTAT